MDYATDEANNSTCRDTTRAVNQEVASTDAPTPRIDSLQMRNMKPVYTSQPPSEQAPSKSIGGEAFKQPSRPSRRFQPTTSRALNPNWAQVR